MPQGQAAIDEGLEENFQRVWLRDSQAGVQLERWFHFAGCRRWLTLERDTRNNQIVRFLDGMETD